MRLGRMLLRRGVRVAAGVTMVSGLAWQAAGPSPRPPAPSPADLSPARRAGRFVEGLPVYRLAELRGPEDRILVAYKDAVYDITEFVAGHPGGMQKIMLAAGGRVDQFWRLHQQHESQDYVLELLEQYRVGNLHPDDKLPDDFQVDAYVMDPERHPSLIVRSPKPFNGETPDEVIAQSWITPNELFYTRNHFPVPLVDPEEYVLEIVLPDGRKHELTLEDLKKFKQHSVVATIQCAGNRRNELSAVKPLRGGKWDGGAISNAEWRGVALRDVLAELGYTTTTDAVKHVHFGGLDADSDKNYGASIPAEIAFSPERDVLLALEMNGEPLPRDHGYPVRAVVPGVVGARNVKWLSRIELAANESEAHWQQRDYRGFPPNVDWDNVEWQSMPSIQELPVISSIAEATPDLEKGTVHLRGYAWSGGGRSVIRVDLSADEGKHWMQAKLEEKPSTPRGRDYSWTLWEASVPVDKNAGTVEIVARATDDSYNTQPESVEHLWNMRGVLNNAWARRSVDLKS